MNIFVQMIYLYNIIDILLIDSHLTDFCHQGNPFFFDFLFIFINHKMIYLLQHISTYYAFLIQNMQNMTYTLKQRFCLRQHIFSFL